jgi:phosphoglycerol transferase MdoB-like AlkP superfamily enzyme
VALCGRWLLAGLALASFAVCLGLLTYYQFFQRPLSLLTLINNFGEGLTFRDAALAGIPTGGALLLGGALAAKLLLLFGRRRIGVPWRPRLVLVAVLLAAQGGLFVWYDRLSPLSRITTTQGVGRLGVLHGYVGAWWAEFRYLYLGREELERRLVEQRRDTSDKLTPAECTIPVHDRLVIVQAETLDFRVLGHRAAGQEVTPFLNALREEALFYRIRAAHFTGSCDADFTVLSGTRPLPNWIMYKIPGFRCESPLPEFLGRYGYATTALHGNTAKFYDRGTAFREMGFAGLEFREELLELPGMSRDGLGVPDHLVLQRSSLLLRQSQRPTCHFLITLTTHTPYKYLRPDQEELFPGATRPVERYFNSMRYLDRCLGEYLTSLGRGVTVLIYGDHTTEVAADGFAPDRDGVREYVPCFIYDSDRNLRQLQQTHVAVDDEPPLASAGGLHLVDVASYLRQQVARSRAAADQPDPGGEAATP